MLNTQRPTQVDITPPSAPRPAAVQLRARRSPKLIALGVLLVVLGGLGAAFLFTLNSDVQPVLAMAADVRRGEVIGREHLSVIEVPAGLNAEALPADRIDELVGQQALFDLPRGAFPLAHQVGEDPLPDGEALVGLRLSHGRIPASDLPPDTVVRLVSLLEGDTSVVSATVAARPIELEDGTFAVDVRVAEDSADALARLAASDLLALVVDEEA